MFPHVGGGAGGSPAGATVPGPSIGLMPQETALHLDMTIDEASIMVETAAFTLHTRFPDSYLSSKASENVKVGI